MKRLVVEIDDDLHHQIRLLAVQRNTSIKEIVLEMLNKMFKPKAKI